VKVAVNKRLRRSKLGLKFAHQDESSPLTISKISEGGLFDETPLVQGLVVLKINDEDVTWMSPKKADSILRKTKKGRITVTAEGFVGKIVRQSRDEKIGIVLHKPRDSSDDIFIWQIKEHSKFAGTDLKAGMRIITINGYQCPSSPKEAIRLMQRTIGKLKIVAIEVNRQKPQQTSSMQIRVEVNSLKPAGSSQDETSQDMRDIKETVSIVPSSITSVSGLSTVSSKNPIRERVKAVLRPLLKDERSVETEEMTDSSVESIEKHLRRSSRKKSKKRALRTPKPEQINVHSHGGIPDVEDPVIDDGGEVQSPKIEEDPVRDQAHSHAVPSSDYIPVLEFKNHKIGEPESIEKHSNRNSHKKPKLRVFRKRKPKEKINIVSHGDIPDSEDTAIDDRDEVQSPKIEEPAARVQDHSKTTSSSDYIPLVEGEPFEELISATKQVIHYIGDKITINAEPETPFDDLTLLSVVSVANDNAKTSLPNTDDNTLTNMSTADDNAQTSLPVTDGNAMTKLSIDDVNEQITFPVTDDNVQTSLSIADDNATLFGEDISLPPDIVEEETFPSDADSPSKNQPAFTSTQVSPPKNPPTVTNVTLLPPKYPTADVHSKQSAEAKHSSRKNDNLIAPIPLKHEHGIVQDVGGRRLQRPQELCEACEEDEIIEQIEGESYDLDDEDVSVNFKLDPPHIQQNSLSEKPSTPSSKGSKNARDPDMDKRRGVDPSERDTSSNVKKLEPPGSRAGVKEPKGRRGREPEQKSSSQDSRHGCEMRQEQTETARLQKRPAHSEQPRHDRWVDREQPETARLQKPPVRPSSHAGCSFIPEDGFIPQEVWDEMQSDFSLFLDRQKNYVESSWASWLG